MTEHAGGRGPGPSVLPGDGEAGAVREAPEGPVREADAGEDADVLPLALARLGRVLVDLQKTYYRAFHEPLGNDEKTKRNAQAFQAALAELGAVMPEAVDCIVQLLEQIRTPRKRRYRNLVLRVPGVLFKSVLDAADSPLLRDCAGLVDLEAEYCIDLYEWIGLKEKSQWGRQRDEQKGPPQ